MGQAPVPHLVAIMTATLELIASIMDAKFTQDEIARLSNTTTPNLSLIDISID
jgi:hypothetical protein